MEEAELERIFQLENDPEVRAFLPSRTISKEKIKLEILENKALYDQFGIGSFTLYYLKDCDFVGRAGFDLSKEGEVEVNYMISKKYWNKKIGQETLSALLQWASTNITFVDKIIGFTPINHLASQKVMERCKMQYQFNDYVDGIECRFYRWDLQRQSN
jgi:ribosomal-protein-alanine N-acetyltransferase